MKKALAIPLCLLLHAATAQTVEYPYWGPYRQIPMDEVRAARWIGKEHVSSGWDWSLPAGTKPVAGSGACFITTFDYPKAAATVASLPAIHFPCNPVVTLCVRWADLEPEEGSYRFDQLRAYIDAAAAKGYSSYIRLHSSATKFAPQWLAAYDVPIRGEKKAPRPGIVNYDVSDPRFHTRYLRLVEELGRSGIPAMPEVRGLYLGYASPSNGDEGIGPEGCDPDTVRHVRERIDAWAAAVKGHERKVYMGGMSDYGFGKGFGVRRGYVEMYLYRIPDPELGQLLDPAGYLVTDERCRVIASGMINGDENEEYGEAWVTAERGFRYGHTTESFPYRYFSANLRLLQMRCNSITFNKYAIDGEMLAWVCQTLGCTAANTPDGWCFLRESYLRPEKGSKEPRAVKNFERWLYQRDTVGYETEPAVKIRQPIEMWMVYPGMFYDFIARRGGKIGFTADPQFLSGRSQRVAVKISYPDDEKGEWCLRYRDNGREMRKNAKCDGKGGIRTATFFITADFRQGTTFDLSVEGMGGYRPTVSFVRVIKL